MPRRCGRIQSASTRASYTVRGQAQKIIIGPCWRRRRSARPSVWLSCRRPSPWACCSSAVQAAWSILGVIRRPAVLVVVQGGQLVDLLRGRAHDSLGLVVQAQAAAAAHGKQQRNDAPCSPHGRPQVLQSFASRGTIPSIAIDSRGIYFPALALANRSATLPQLTVFHQAST